MNSHLVYRATFYLMLILSTTILSVDTSDSPIDRFLPAAVTVAGLLAFMSVDQSPRWGLPRGLANLLALATLGLLYFEYHSQDSLLIRCLGHWVTYLLIIKSFLPKTAQDDWFLFLLGLTQVLIGSVVNQGDTVGAWLIVWALVGVWVLGQFFLQREARRLEGGEAGEGLPLSALAEAGDPYGGLFDAPYAAASLRVLGLTLLMGGVFFLLLPRQAGATRARTSATMARHLTGFDEEVKLGQLGEILENDTVVMSVEFSDEERVPIHPAGEPLWRGVALTQYDHGRWRRQQQRPLQTIVSLRLFKNDARNPRKLIRQAIKLEPNDSATLFGMRPFLELSAGPRLPPVLNPIDGTIFRPEARGGYDYEVLSDANIDAPQENEAPPSPSRRKMLMAIPEDLKARFREICMARFRQLGGSLLEEPDAGDHEAVLARARALESYLRDDRRFGYTLEMTVGDPTLDPVEDFLINRKQGHCEYFASALALLLRSVDIPARVVNGFKGGDWNNLTQSMNVRQKHAHSWVEAYLGQATEKQLPVWITLDPTPASARDEAVAQVGGFGTSLRPFTDFIRYVWVFYILGYDAGRQNRLLYSPIRDAVMEVRRGYSLLWTVAQQGFGRLFRFQSISSFISIRGFLVSFIVLSLVALTLKALIWLGRRLQQWWRGPVDDSLGLTAGILFYRRLTQLLSNLELRRSPAETHGEFAVRASRLLALRGVETQAVADVPRQIVDAFHLVRFGHRDLDETTLADLERNLDSLETQLNQP